jgi:hypothetical protein
LNDNWVLMGGKLGVDVPEEIEEGFDVREAACRWFRINCSWLWRLLPSVALGT